MGGSPKGSTHATSSRHKHCWAAWRGRPSPPDVAIPDRLSNRRAVEIVIVSELDCQSPAEHSPQDASVLVGPGHDRLLPTDAACELKSPTPLRSAPTHPPRAPGS